MNKTHTQIVVIGAGYAGLLATVRLAGKTRRTNVAITLVNADATFVERLRLHQIAANQPRKQRPIHAPLQGTGVYFVQGFVTGIDLVEHTVAVKCNEHTLTLPYDRLLYALGSTIDRDRVPGVRDHAYTFIPSGPRSAETLRTRLPVLNRSGGRVLICGGGATGVEAAAEFAESYPQLNVCLITSGTFGMFLGAGIANYMRQSLTRRGVTIHDHTTVAEVRADAVVTTAGNVLPCDLCVWTGGFSVPDLARVAGLTVNECGQVLIDPFMRSISHPEVYAVGDAAHPVEEPGAPVRMSAFTATVMGAHVADVLAATVRGKEPKPLSFAYLGQGIALGRHDAIGFNNYPCDRPNRPYFTGRVGSAVREFFVNFLVTLPALERRWPGFFYWVGKGRYLAAKRRLSRQKQRPASAF